MFAAVDGRFRLFVSFTHMFAHFGQITIYCYYLLLPKIIYYAR